MYYVSLDCLHKCFKAIFSLDSIYVTHCDLFYFPYSFLIFFFADWCLFFLSSVFVSVLLLSIFASCSYGHCLLSFSACYNLIGPNCQISHCLFSCLSSWMSILVL